MKAVKFVMLALVLSACGGKIDDANQQAEPISLCQPQGGAGGLVDPVKFCEEIPWTWIDREGNEHPCTETCAAGLSCQYVNPDPSMGPMVCADPTH